METPFEDLSEQGRFDRLDRAQASLDWQAANSPAGGVILHLRTRAAATRNTAKLFLWMLVLTILTGLAFYLGLPFWQTWADGRQEALQETIDGITPRKRELDDDRTELLKSGTLTNGEKAQGLSALLKDAFVAIPTGTVADLRGAIIYRDRLFVFGDQNTVLRLNDEGDSFEKVKTNGYEDFEWAFTHSDRLFFLNSGGGVHRLTDSERYLEGVTAGRGCCLDWAVTHGDRLFVDGGAEAVRRLSDDGDYFEKVPTGKTDGLFGGITHGDRLFVFGWGGTVLRLKTDSTGFERVPTGTDANLLGAITHKGRLFVVGLDGTVRRLTADGTRFEDVPSGTDSNLWGAITHGGKLYVFGEQGKVRRLTADGAAFEDVPSGTQVKLEGAVSEGDRLFVFGEGGTMLRLTAEGAGFEQVPTGLKASPAGAITHGNRVFLFGEGGTVLVSTDAPASAASTLPSDPDEASRGKVEAFFDGLPPHIREHEPVRALRDRLRLFASQRNSYEQIEAETKADLAALRENPLQYLRERETLDFSAFLNTCRGGATATADITTACLTAWQSEQAIDQRSWWETLADQVPPGILLLFLLATLGGLYRYNLRLAGFHESRADALQLLAQGRDAAQLRDILAASPGDAVNLATIFLGADKVEMGTIKAKLGQAEIELAKALNSSD